MPAFLLWMLAWQNLVFELPIGGAVLYALYIALAGGGDHGHDVSVDHDVDVSVDHDADVSADAGADTDVHVDTDADAETDTDAETDSGSLAPVHVAHALDQGHADTHGADQGNAWMKTLVFLGAGRAPVSLILITLMMLWGVVGLLGNTILDKFLPLTLAFLPSCAAAGFVSLGCTRFLARALGRVLPTTTTTTITPFGFQGLLGTVTVGVDDRFGLVHVYDQYGNLHELKCRVAAGQPQIPQGARVVLMRYDLEEQCFEVRPDPLGELASAERLALPTGKE